MVGSGFLGKEEEEISDEQTGEVVCELANMFCGSALSRLEAQTTFRLSHPELVAAESGTPFELTGIARWFELESGSLAASLSFPQAL
jgi:CheY-specific phosphatase CheX